MKPIRFDSDGCLTCCHRRPAGWCPKAERLVALPTEPERDRKLWGLGCSHWKPSDPSRYLPDDKRPMTATEVLHRPSAPVRLDSDGCLTCNSLQPTGYCGKSEGSMSVKDRPEADQKLCGTRCPDWTPKARLSSGPEPGTTAAVEGLVREFLRQTGMPLESICLVIEPDLSRFAMRYRIDAVDVPADSRWRMRRKHLELALKESLEEARRGFIHGKAWTNNPTWEDALVLHRKVLEGLLENLG